MALHAIYLLGAALVGSVTHGSLRLPGALLYAALGIASSPPLVWLFGPEEFWDAAAWGALAAAIFWLASATRGPLGRTTTTVTTSATAPRPWALAMLSGLAFALVFGAVSYVYTTCRVVSLELEGWVAGKLWSHGNYREVPSEWWSLPLGPPRRTPVVIALMSGALGTSIAVVSRRLGQNSRSRLIHFGLITVGCLVGGAVCWLLYVASTRNSALLLATLVHSFDWALLVASLCVALAWLKRPWAGVWLAVAVAAVVSVQFADLGSNKMELQRRSAWEPERDLFFLVQATLGAAVAAARARMQLGPAVARTGRAVRTTAAVIIVSGCVLLQIDGHTWFEATGLQGRLTPTASCAGPEQAASILIELGARPVPRPMAIYDQIRAAPPVATGGGRKVELLASLDAPVTRLAESLAVAAGHGYDLAVIGERFEEVDLLTLAPVRVGRGRCVLLETSLQRLAHGARPPGNVATVSQLVAWLNST
ncbi:MAG TPA: hypothetical protein VFU02_02150 [Polyangiaceae bacterium]|nr:hypothetical protein [Polyangiaceae bacterium]